MRVRQNGRFFAVQGGMREDSGRVGTTAGFRSLSSCFGGASVGHQSDGMVGFAGCCVLKWRGAGEGPAGWCWLRMISVGGRESGK